MVSTRADPVVPDEGDDSTAPTIRNGIVVAKYWVYVGVGIRATSASNDAARNQSGSRPFTRRSATAATTPGAAEQHVLRHRPRLRRDAEQVRDHLRLLLEVPDEAALAPDAVDAEIAEQERMRIEREEDERRHQCDGEAHREAQQTLTGAERLPGEGDGRADDERPRLHAERRQRAGGEPSTRCRLRPRDHDVRGEDERRRQGERLHRRVPGENERRGGEEHAPEQRESEAEARVEVSRKQNADDEPEDERERAEDEPVLPEELGPGAVHVREQGASACRGSPGTAQRRRGRASRPPHSFPRRRRRSEGRQAARGSVPEAARPAATASVRAPNAGARRSMFPAPVRRGSRPSRGRCRSASP